MILSEEVLHYLHKTTIEMEYYRELGRLMSHLFLPREILLEALKNLNRKYGRGQPR